MDLNLQYDAREMAQAVRSDPKTAYFYTVIGSIVAGYGITDDSEPTMIGSMLISPIGGKLLEILFTYLSNQNMNKPLTELGVEVLICVMIGRLMTWVTKFRVREAGGTLTTRYTVNTDRSNIIHAFTIAVLCGAILFVATVGSKGGLTSTAVGVSIATSLLPPLVNAGLLSASNRWKMARFSGLLFLVNVFGILTGAYLVHAFAGAGRL